MKYVVVMNACSGDLAVRSSEMKDLLRQPGCLERDGTTLLLHTGEAPSRMVPTPSAVLVRVSRYQPEQALDILEELAPQLGAGLYLFSDDVAGRELAVRLGHRLGGTSLAGVRAFHLDGETLRCRKAVYSGHMEATFRLTRGPFCLSITGPGTAPLPVAGTAPVVLMDLDRRQAPPDWVESFECIPDPSEARLENASFVLAAGMGARDRHRAARMAEIAREIGAEFGATRPVVMNAWAPMDRLVGVSGATLRPRLCIVAGASGSAAFMAGIEHSQFIVAINQDEQAPILRCCDVGAVGDGMAILEELARLIREGA
jgi:electron transfer flavoprotein alpha subunit